MRALEGAESAESQIAEIAEGRSFAEGARVACRLWPATWIERSPRSQASDKKH